MTKSFQLTSKLSIGDGHPLVLFAGPCQIESRDHSLTIAQFLQEHLSKLQVQLVFKASFDKANRSKLTSARGVGIEEGLRILEDVRKETGLPVITDIHTSEQVAAVAEVVDILQIPAFLCRQTDLLVAAGQSGRPIHVKKGQFLHPSDMALVAEKIASTGNSKIILCERGTCFGYRDLIVDPRSLIIMRETGYPVSFDATHSVQTIGSESGTSGGQRRFIEPLARAAVACGIDALFFECHENPSQAPSDGMSMLELERVPSFVSQLVHLRKAVTE